MSKPSHLASTYKSDYIIVHTHEQTAGNKMSIPATGSLTGSRERVTLPLPVPIRPSAKLQKGEPAQPILTTSSPSLSLSLTQSPRQLLFMPSLGRSSHVLGFHPSSDGRHLYCLSKRPWRRRRVFSRRRRISAKT